MSAHPSLDLQKGDTVEAVQHKLGLTHAPTPSPDTDPPANHYHLADVGVWVFFNEHNKVYSIRFDAPFAHAIEGVKIGDTKDAVVAARGQPDRQMQMPDRKARWIWDRPRFLRVDFDPKTNVVEKVFR